MHAYDRTFRQYREGALRATMQEYGCTRAMAEQCHPADALAWQQYERSVESEIESLHPAVPRAVAVTWRPSFHAYLRKHHDRWYSAQEWKYDARIIGRPEDF